MASKSRFSFWQIIKYPPQFIYRIGLGPIYGRLVLLLTTTGRITGLPRVTPLQYEEIDGKIMVGSARGTKADWFKNIQADPIVWVRIKAEYYQATAEPITDPTRVADFLEFRLKKHPLMIGLIMSREGIPKNPTRSDLEKHAKNKALVEITAIK